MGFRTDKKYKWDPNAPRLGKGEFSTIILTKELYNSSGFSGTWKEFQDIWIAIAEEIKKEITENPLGVKLPFFLGELKIQYLPYKMNTVEDPIASAIVGEPVPFVNIHSKGKSGKLVWERKEARKFNKVLDMWAYEPSDLLEMEVGKALKTNPDKFRIAKTRISNRKKVVFNQ